MGNRKSFWKQVREKIEDFILESIDDIFDCVRELRKAIKEESNMYFGFLTMLGFGVVTFLFSRNLSNVERKRALFAWAGIAISSGSIAMILIQVASTILHKLGLLDALIKIRDIVLDIVLKKFKTNDKSEEDIENQATLSDDVPISEEQKKLLPEKEISTLDFRPINAQKQLLPTTVESTHTIKDVTSDSKPVVKQVKM